MFFYKDGFGIKLPSKVDKPLSKEIKIKNILNCNLYGASGIGSSICCIAVIQIYAET